MSLFELITATLVLAILILAGYQSYKGFLDRTHEGRERLALIQVAGSAQQYEQARGFLPTTKDELERLEPSLEFSGTALPREFQPGTVSFYYDGITQEMAVAMQTAKGDCVTSTVPTFGSATAPERWVYAVTGTTRCSAQTALNPPPGLERRPW